MAIWSAEIKELERLYESFKGQLPDLEKELGKLIKADDENMILLYSRRCLEVIITDLCECELKRDRGTEPLKGIIDKLHKEKKIPPHIIASVHSLNELSTFGTHPKDFDSEQVKPVLNNLDIIIKWYLKYKGVQVLSKPKHEDEKFENKVTTIATKEKSIIVLPFENISPDPDQEYFSDGLTEEVITDLSHIQDLLVISRNSAMTFKGTKKKTNEIASEVNVRYVLEGSVRKSGNNLRIIAQLIDAFTDTHFWAEKYSGTLDDVFDIQEKVSRSIADALKLKLSPEENKKIAEHKVDNIQVYECYLKARQDLWKYTEESLARAEQTLKNGLSFLGEHELLYSGLGWVYFNLYDSGIRYEKECLIKLKDCIDKIFKSNPGSAKGYHLSGLLKLKTENSHESYKDIKRALALNPSDPDIIFISFYILCVHLGRNSQAALLAKRILEVDPLTPINQGFIGWYNIVNGHFDNALISFRKWYDMEPDSLLPLWYISLAMVFSKNFEDAYTFIDNKCQQHPDSIFLKFSMLLKYSLQKKKEEFLKLLTEDIKQIGWNDYHLPWFIAECYALLEEKEQSIKWLERAVEWGFINYPLLSEIDPLLENIRGEERFKKLMERVKYEWENFEV
jgi:non-specific serine/threonine protein kinase